MPLPGEEKVETKRLLTHSKVIVPCLVQISLVSHQLIMQELFRRWELFGLAREPVGGLADEFGGVSGVG